MTDAAIVLETHNLDHYAPARRAEVLHRRVSDLVGQGHHAGGSVEVVIVHRGLTAAERDAVPGAPRLVEVGPDCDYYEAKNAGVAATAAPFIALADADCTPNHGWLAALLAPLRGGNARVVAGRTAYPNGAVGDALTALDFALYPNPFEPGAVRNFYANNVAFERAVFLDRRFPSRRTHRGQCAAFACRLFAERIAICSVPGARMTHPLPSSLHALIVQRMHRGADLRSIAPELITAHANRSVARITRRMPSAFVLTGRAITALRGVGGSAPGVGCVAAISTLDAVGAVRGWARGG